MNERSASGGLKVLNGRFKARKLQTQLQQSESIIGGDKIL